MHKGKVLIAIGTVFFVLTLAFGLYSIWTEGQVAENAGSTAALFGLSGLAAFMAGTFPGFWD